MRTSVNEKANGFGPVACTNCDPVIVSKVFVRTFMFELNLFEASEALVALVPSSTG